MSTFECRVQYLDDNDPFCSTNFPEPNRPPLFTFLTNVPLRNQIKSVHKLLNAPQKEEECTLQVYRISKSNVRSDAKNQINYEYGPYLDVDSSLDEQSDDVDCLRDTKHASLIIRTQLSIRVKYCIDRLYNCNGKELRRALFSLKQIFQDDKDLVQEFVNRQGLECLIYVGKNADQNFQNYILRALGQLMLFVDGMNGVIQHQPTIEWLYSLVTSNYRLVVKTTLKLLIIFVEYIETNAMLLHNAIVSSDQKKNKHPWRNFMMILNDLAKGDLEIILLTITLINTTLNSIPTRETFYEICNILEIQGISSVCNEINKNTKKIYDNGLIEQFKLYEAAIRQENGDKINNNYLIKLRNVRRTSFLANSLMEHFATDDTSSEKSTNNNIKDNTNLARTINNNNNNNINTDDYSRKSNSISISQSPRTGGKNSRFDQQQQFVSETVSKLTNGEKTGKASDDYKDNSRQEAALSVQDKIRQRKRERELAKQNKENINIDNRKETANKKSTNETPTSSIAFSATIANNSNETKTLTETEKKDNGNGDGNSTLKSEGLASKIEALKLKQKKSNCDYQRTVVEQFNRGTSQFNGTATSSSHVNSTPQNVQTMTNVTQVTKKLTQQSTIETKTRPLSPNHQNKNEKPEVVKENNEGNWQSLFDFDNSKQLKIKDYDFTDLTSTDDKDILMTFTNGNPPPPPPLPSPGSGGLGLIPPPPPLLILPGIPPPPCAPPICQLNDSQLFATSLGQDSTSQITNSSMSNKPRKTLKLHWRDAVLPTTQLSPQILTSFSQNGATSIWDELTPVDINTNKLDELFETKQSELKVKRGNESKKYITVLGAKRSNAINIGMTALPPPRTIKTAILKMDTAIIGKDGIEKLLTMIPTEEEKVKIIEAQMTQPEVPLGSAEQFLLTLSSITELEARLKLWLFKMEYESMEKEILEPLMDLKVGMDILKNNKTFKRILEVLLAVGNHLNGSQSKGFQIDYLTKVPDVKDTLYKHTLLYHVCDTMMEKYDDLTDLYSEIGPITRCSDIDWDQLSQKLNRLETDCKAAFKFLKTVINKAETNSVSINNLKNKTHDFLVDCAQRISTLKIIHRRIINRYKKFLIWLGYSKSSVPDHKVHMFCKTISEFALEYRTTREKKIQQKLRRENKSRGRLITDKLGNRKDSFGRKFSTSHQCLTDAQMN
ncbi:hypothetical protein SNEBB_002534, partial [Seison nebaliae]